MRADSATPSPAIGSSSSSSCGLVASAIASSSSRCSPWLSSDTDDVGALAEPDPRQRRVRRLAQTLFLARIAPEPERVPVMRLHRERDIVGAVKSGSSEVIWNERASPSRLRRWAGSR